VERSTHVTRFEVPNTFRRIFNFLLVPVLNNLPPVTLSVFAKSHRSAKKVIEHKTEHVALEVLYSHGTTFSSRNLLERIALWVWFGLDNSMAVRNRLKIVKREVQAELAIQFEKKEVVYVLSIASGSARAVLEAIANTIEKCPGRQLRVTFLDKNPYATQYSKHLAQELGLLPHKEINISWVTATVGNYLAENAGEKHFDIVEMVGLLDYFDDHKAINTFRSILSSLKPEGVFICANISDNRERKFVTNFIGWKMIYRDAEKLVSLLIRAGFKKDSIFAFYEPLKIHSVTCARNIVS